MSIGSASINKLEILYLYSVSANPLWHLMSPWDANLYFPSCSLAARWTCPIWCFSSCQKWLLLFVYRVGFNFPSYFAYTTPTQLATLQSKISDFTANRLPAHPPEDNISYIDTCRVKCQAVQHVVMSLQWTSQVLIIYIEIFTNICPNLTMWK